MSSIVDILDANSLMVLATINEDGTPWATPLKFGTINGKVYWRSSEVTIHSQNIARDRRISITVFDNEIRAGTGAKQALYIQSVATKLDDSEQAVILELIGERFSQRDDSMPIYAAAIGDIDENKSTNNRFYSIYKGEDES